MSQDCVNYLSKNNKKYTKTNHRFRHRGNSEEIFIKIRWSCGKLGQYSEEGKFFIEPKAHFKLVFGCGIGAQTQVPMGLSSIRSINSSRSNKNNRVSDQAAKGFQRGIEDQTLLPLKRAPSSFSVMENKSPTLAELEQELHYVYTTHSGIEDDLLACNDPRRGSTSTAASEVPRTALDFPSLGNSGSSEDSYFTSNYLYTATPSTSTSISEQAYTTNTPQPLSGALLGDRLSTHSSTNLPYDRWLNQSLHEEPQPWGQNDSLSITPCQSLDSRAYSLLEEAKRKAEKEASEYWIWDATVGNYKHYDAGSNDPVWYNPPS